MNIFTIRDNLIQTIGGKEALSSAYWDAIRTGEMDAQTGVAMVEFLKINIGELRTILNDIEHVCTKTTSEIYRNG